MRLIHFEEWWVRLRAGVAARRFVQRGIETATATPEALDAIRTADVVLVAPSNPVVSIGTILALPGITDALRQTSAPIVGVSPIIGGHAVRGMADACLETIGVECSAHAVALHYGARQGGGLLDGWLVGIEDEASVAALNGSGIRAEAAPLWMHDVTTSGAIARAAIELASR